VQRVVSLNASAICIAGCSAILIAGKSYAIRVRTDMLRWYSLRLASQGKAAIKIAECAAMNIAEKPAS
jgi:hypothetical protein